MMTQPDTSGRPYGVQSSTGEIHIHSAAMLMAAQNICTTEAECNFFLKKN